MARFYSFIWIISLEVSPIILYYYAPNHEDLSDSGFVET
jgi:hypothetical protein